MVLTKVKAPGLIGWGAFLYTFLFIGIFIVPFNVDGLEELHQILFEFYCFFLD